MQFFPAFAALRTKWIFFFFLISSVAEM